MCIITRFQCTNPDCLQRDTRHNECMTPTTCTTSITIVERNNGCCKCIHQNEQGPCVHRARQLHPGEVSRLQTTSHLAQSSAEDVDVFYSSDEESPPAENQSAARSIEQNLSEQSTLVGVDQENEAQEGAVAGDVVGEGEEGGGHQESDQNNHGSGSAYEPEPMMFEMEEV